jgi:hypothetical protein
MRYGKLASAISIKQTGDAPEPEIPKDRCNGVHVARPANSPTKEMPGNSYSHLIRNSFIGQDIFLALCQQNMSSRKNTSLASRARM